MARQHQQGAGNVRRPHFTLGENDPIGWRTVASAWANRHITKCATVPTELSDTIALAERHSEGAVALSAEANWNQTIDDSSYAPTLGGAYLMHGWQEIYLGRHLADRNDVRRRLTGRPKLLVLFPGSGCSAVRDAGFFPPRSWVGPHGSGIPSAICTAKAPVSSVPSAPFHRLRCRAARR